MGEHKYIFNKSEDGQKANILIDGEIDSWWGVGLKSFAKDIANSNASEIMVQINSVGGSVAEGTAIAAYIKGSPSNISTSILGLCASIATTIAVAGKTTSIAKGSLFMIHNASGGTWGGSEDMRKTADLLDTIDDTLTNLYVDTIEKNGKLINGSREETKTKVIEWQNAETWFTAEEAVENGFIQKVVEGVEFVNKATAQRILNSCSKYDNVPTDFINNFKNIANMAEPAVTPKENPTEETFGQKMRNWFNGNPDEAKELVNEITESQEAKDKKALEAATALLIKNGLKVVDSTEPEAEAEAEAEPEVKEESAAFQAMQAKLAKAEAKALKLEEEKAGASASTPKDQAGNEASIFNKSEMEGFNSIAKALKNK
jgi:ATP-dependent Clp protease protease subunit